MNDLSSNLNKIYFSNSNFQFLSKSVNTINDQRDAIVNFLDIFFEKDNFRQQKSIFCFYLTSKACSSKKNEKLGIQKLVSYRSSKSWIQLFKLSIHLPIALSVIMDTFLFQISFDWDRAQYSLSRIWWHICNLILV